jgi:TM2 domain-containing membrane protein YozV
MNCHLHQDRPAVGTCVGCGKFICEECKTEIQGKYYCKKCVEELIAEKTRKIEKLEDNKNPMVFMNAGGGGASSASSSSSSSAGAGGYMPICTKSKVVAGLLGIFLGGIGAHKFYLGRTGMGILYLLFCWTGIPAFIGFIEGIVYLVSSEQAFNAKYCQYVRM